MRSIQRLVLLLSFSAMCVYSAPPDRGFNLQQVWSSNLADGLATPPTCNESMCWLNAADRMVAVDNKGDIQSEVKLLAVSLAPVLVTEDYLLVHTVAGVECFDLSGQRIWHFKRHDSGPYLDAKSWGLGEGKIPDMWVMLRSAPVLYQDRVIITDSNGVMALELSSGAVLWQQETDAITATPILYKESVIVATWADQVIEFDAKTGEHLWQFQGHPMTGLGAGWQGWNGIQSTPMLADEYLYVPSRSSYLYILNLDKRAEAGSIKEASTWLVNEPTLAGEYFYLGLSDGRAVKGFNRRTGNQKVHINTKGPIFARILANEDYLVVGTITGEILIVAADTGTVITERSIAQSDKSYKDYFQPYPDDANLSLAEQATRRVARLFREKRAVSGLDWLGNQLVVTTASGDVFGFELSPSDAL